MARENQVLLDSTPSGTGEGTIGTVGPGKVWEIHFIQVNNIDATTDATLILKLNDITKLNLVNIPSEANEAGSANKVFPYKYILNADETVKATVSVADALNIDFIGVEYDA